MTRDFELIRQIILQIEQAPAGEPIGHLLVDADPMVFMEHLCLLLDAGLLDGEVVSMNPAIFNINRLTWAGHDFIEHARNNTIFKRVLAEAKEKGLSVTLTVLNGLLSKAAEKYAGLGS